MLFCRAKYVIVRSAVSLWGVSLNKLNILVYSYWTSVTVIGGGTKPSRTILAQTDGADIPLAAELKNKTIAENTINLTDFIFWPTCPGKDVYAQRDVSPYACKLKY
jgi:hypothetical protein